MPLACYRVASVFCCIVATVSISCAPLTVNQERELGEDFERAVKREVVFLRDDVVLNYIDQLGQDILRAAGPQPFRYEFFLIENEEINAFAAPGGRIYLHTGTVLKAENVGELTGVIAHEIGHVVARHIAENYKRGRTVGLGKQAVEIAVGILWGSHAAGGADLVGDLAAATYLNSFGRQAEHEADKFAVGVMIKAGYDPQGLVSFFQTLKDEAGPTPPSFLSSHPTTDDRIQETQSLIDEAEITSPLKITDGGRLEVIQKRIKLRMGTWLPEEQVVVHSEDEESGELAPDPASQSEEALAPVY